MNLSTKEQLLLTASASRTNLASPPFVVDFDLGQATTVLLEVADLHECRPQLNRSLDDTHHIFSDAQQDLLKEVGLEVVERYLEIRCE